MAWGGVLVPGLIRIVWTASHSLRESVCGRKLQGDPFSNQETEEQQISQGCRRSGYRRLFVLLRGEGEHRGSTGSTGKKG